MNEKCVLREICIDLHGKSFLFLLDFAKRFFSYLQEINALKENRRSCGFEIVSFFVSFALFRIICIDWFIWAWVANKKNRSCIFFAFYRNEIRMNLYTGDNVNLISQNSALFINHTYSTHRHFIFHFLLFFFVFIFVLNFSC